MNLENRNETSIPENDILVDAAVELANELGKNNVPLILGGGLSLYIRTKYLPKRRSPRYKSQIVQRSTKDIDIFLTGDLIINTSQIVILRDTLNILGYTPFTEYFQFEKKTLFDHTINIDILSAPLAGDLGKNIRIKPKNVEHFHAHRSNEAKGIHIGLIPIDNLSEKQIYSNLFIISSFNYIILKLHAFRDRVMDERVDYGRHHAYDIFATILDMDENDWNNAREHFKAEVEQEYIKSSINIIKQDFNQSSDLGVIRLQENELYRRSRQEFDTYIPDYLIDLKDLFLI